MVVKVEIDNLHFFGHLARAVHFCAAKSDVFAEQRWIAAMRGGECPALRDERCAASAKVRDPLPRIDQDVLAHDDAVKKTSIAHTSVQTSAKLVVNRVCGAFQVFRQERLWWWRESGDGRGGGQSAPGGKQRSGRRQRFWPTETVQTF